MKSNNSKKDNLILDDYEYEIENSIPKDFKPVYLSDIEKEKFSKVAERHKQYKASKRINIRIKNEDLIRIRAKAKENNMPYQTLLSTLIHKYAKNDVKIHL
ncbi:antitoxin [candidate division WWE3 bacterium CG10_big_fil_rev_8_21_14_0_10_32_10]|uniref:Antitoxin n=1 Tax=candidate division WWE3 bacterium CG10_big_fil_rev_8_21_14_0_10_32_10 TaxID=1975090 RepID=A0A2H0R9I5_UNCKA|nr:MAG: antitoxin [candidate division WWE3 bacterium CG10_big_fil_rev_8_21_14_0_10_32_10]